MNEEQVHLLISGASIVDGTGAPARSGDLAISGDRIRLVTPGDDPAIHAARTIDARGKVVAPGFIDLHSHAGLMILADPDHTAKVRQGVTTELVGVDGLSYAPFPNAADRDALVEMNAGLDGDPRDSEGARGTSGKGRPVTIDWATASSTRSARRSRSASAVTRPPTSPTSTTGRRSRARPTRCSSSSTTRPPPVRT